MKYNELTSEIENNNNSILLINRPEMILKDYISFIKEINTIYDGIILNFRAPSISEKKIFSNNDINLDKITFIDGICVSADEMPEDKNIHYLMSPNDLAGINATLNAVFANKIPKYIVIDLLDVLLYYNTIDKIKEMINNLKDIAKSKNISIFIFANSENESLINNFSGLFDKVISLKGD